MDDISYLAHVKAVHCCNPGDLAEEVPLSAQHPLRQQLGVVRKKHTEVLEPGIRRQVTALNCL